MVLGVGWQPPAALFQFVNHSLDRGGFDSMKCTWHCHDIQLCTTHGTETLSHTRFACLVTALQMPRRASSSSVVGADLAIRKWSERVQNRRLLVGKDLKVCNAIVLEWVREFFPSIVGCAVVYSNIGANAVSDFVRIFRCLKISVHIFGALSLVELITWLYWRCGRLLMEIFVQKKMVVVENEKRNTENSHRTESVQNLWEHKIDFRCNFALEEKNRFQLVTDSLV